MPWEQDLERALTDVDAQSTASSDAAMMVGLDYMSAAGTDNNTMSGFSSESGQQEASPLEERDTKQGLYETYLRDMDREFPEASAVAAGRHEEDEGQARAISPQGEIGQSGFQEDETHVGDVGASVSTLSLSEQTTVIETLVEERTVSHVEIRGDEEERVRREDGTSFVAKVEIRHDSVTEMAEPIRGEGQVEAGGVDRTGEIPPQDHFDHADGNDDDDDGVNGNNKVDAPKTDATFSYPAVTTYLEEGAREPVLEEQSEEKVDERRELAGVSRSEREASFSATDSVDKESTRVIEGEDAKSRDLGDQLAEPIVPTWPVEGELARNRLRPHIFLHHHQLLILSKVGRNFDQLFNLSIFVFRFQLTKIIRRFCCCIIIIKLLTIFWLPRFLHLNPSLLCCCFFFILFSFVSNLYPKMFSPTYQRSYGVFYFMRPHFFHFPCNLNKDCKVKMHIIVPI